MLWHILKYYLCFVIEVFFKRSYIKNAQHLRVKGPVIIAMNHPNAFMDPIALSVLGYPPRMYYLARGDAFKKGIVSTMLESIGIIPIFRIQDGGKEGLKKNDETYERVNALLKKNNKIIIFAEGLCIQERRLRSLKKGVPRMVFGAMDAFGLEDLTVVPVGINYSDASKFRGEIFINVGEPIAMNTYTASYKEVPAKTMNQFLADLAVRMKELIVNIDHKETEKIIEHIEEIYSTTYLKQNNLKNTLENKFAFSQHVTAIFNVIYSQTPEVVENINNKATSYQIQLKQLGLKDWLFDESNKLQLNYFSVCLRFLLLVLSIPLLILGLIGNYIPYKLANVLVAKKVKLIEFKASFLMGIGAFSFLLYYLLQFFIVKAFVPNYWVALAYIAIMIFTGVACLHVIPFYKKTVGILKTLQLKNNNPKAYEKLHIQRSEIINEFIKLENI